MTVFQSTHAEYVPSSPLGPQSPLVNKVQVQVLKTARALTRPRGVRIPHPPLCVISQDIEDTVNPH